MWTGTDLFQWKISKNRLVCKNAVALTYYGSCKLQVIGYCQYTFTEKKHLTHFCQIFSELLLTVIDKMREKKIQRTSSLTSRFQA